MIAPLSESHLDEVERIESQEGDVHWSRLQFEKELGSEFIRFFVISSPLSSPAGVHAVNPSLGGSENKVIAYGGYWKAGLEAQITNLVVRRDHRCQGHAKRLLGFLMDCARSEECSAMTLEVRAGNAHARALYAKMGFCETGRRAKLYKNPEEDAVMMETRL